MKPSVCSVRSGAMSICASRKFCFALSRCEKKMRGGMPSRTASYVSGGVSSLMTMWTDGSVWTGAAAIARATWAPTRSASNTAGP